VGTRRSNHHAFYDQVLNEIIKELERGTRPWECPWIGGDPPRNHLTLHYYAGVNELILLNAAHNLDYPHHRWISAKQAARMGGRIRDGERGTTIVVGRRYSRRSDGPDRDYARGFGRLYVVFNIAQCDGISMPIPPKPKPSHKNKRIERLVRATGVKVQIGGVEAFLDPADPSCIHVPPQRLFYEPAAYYRTLLHEIAHAVMGPYHLDIPLPKMEAGEQRVWAEIVAELASAFVCRAVGIALAVRPADYIGEWLAILRSIRRVVAFDPRWIVEVLHHARDVADCLLGFDSPRDA
jgi:antirestriction protein ArdC